MTDKPFIPYGRQSITEEDIAAVAAALRAAVITRGPKVEEFENAISVYCGSRHAVAFPNGTIALEAAYHAAGVGEKDRLITTPNTFVATTGAAMKQGATPVFVDIDLETGNMNLEQVAHTLEYRRSTRGKNIIAPVHFSGIPVDIKQLDGFLKEPDDLIIEDAAHALGSRYPSGEKVGSCAFSAMTCLSFHPVKHITTGEGGMVTTNDDDLAHRLRRFRNNGIEREQPYLKGQPAPWYYEVQEITGNYNFTELQAALGLSQLKRLDAMVEKRRKLVARYRKRLNGQPHVKMLAADYDHLTAFHLCVVLIDFASLGKTREAVMEQLRAEGIGTQVHYIPVYRHPFFKEKSGDLSSYFPEMELYYAQALSLPLFYDLSEVEVDYVVDTLVRMVL